MNVPQKNKEKGFTIIEVVLVLAIAGLIFLMVFIALPALQRNQRDTQRRNDLSRAQTAVTNYQTNNRNKLPVSSTDWQHLITNYLKVGGDSFADPSNGDYVFDVSGTYPPVYNTTTPSIFVYPSKVCDGENLVAAGAQKVALEMKLEGGGIACVNN
jgi:prepilin-type N-terminal cleavage/methylation domain-containing protein